jgi:hypothetical protein
MYKAWQQWKEDGLLPFDTFCELMDHGIDPEALTETFETLSDINTLMEDEDYNGEHETEETDIL